MTVASASARIHLSLSAGTCSFPVFATSTISKIVNRAYKILATAYPLEPPEQSLASASASRL